MKYALISAFLGQTKDRFSYYNEDKTVEEKLAMIAEMEGVTGVELVYPYEVQDPTTTAKLVEKYDVKIAAINVNVKAEPEFVGGGLTSSDPEVRARAVQFIKEAKDFAVEVGANKVTCCPLSDGYEFNFQCDYIEKWEYLRACFDEASRYRPEIPLFIEYKPSETRGRCLLNDAAKTVLLIKEIGNPALGVTLDYGHSLYGDNNPAEDLCLIHHAGVPYYIHINDNDGKWDWDYFCGSKSLLNYYEFMYYLKLFNYDDYLTSDTSPTRWDIKKMFELNARISEKISDRIDQYGVNALKELIHSDDYMDKWLVIEEELLNMK